MQEFDIVIRNGMIVDGARNPRWKGDIGIRDGMITRMGKIANPRAKRVIDADGLRWCSVTAASASRRWRRNCATAR